MAEDPKANTARENCQKIERTERQMQRSDGGNPRRILSETKGICPRRPERSRKLRNLRETLVEPSTEAFGSPSVESWWNLLRNLLPQWRTWAEPRWEPSTEAFGSPRRIRPRRNHQESPKQFSAGNLYYVFKDSHHFSRTLGSLWWQSLKTAITEDPKAIAVEQKNTTHPLQQRCFRSLADFARSRWCRRGWSSPPPRVFVPFVLLFVVFFNWFFTA